MVSNKEQEQIEILVQCPASVLAATAKRMASDCKLSEAECLEIAGMYAEAAEIARGRRLAANSYSQEEK